MDDETAPEGLTAPAPEGRLYTIDEAAQLLGITKKAMRSRVDRSQAAPEKHSSLQIMKDAETGERMIPHDELVRVGLLRPNGQPSPAPLTAGPPRPVRPAEPEAPPQPQVIIDVDAMLERVERLSTQLAERRLLESQAGAREDGERRAREAAERELVEARAQLRAAEERAEAAEARLAAAQREEPQEPPAGGSGGGGDAGQGAGVAAQVVERQGWWSRLTGRSGMFADPVPAPA